MALMKSITPERIQQEFEEKGSGDFGFAFGTEAASAWPSSSKRVSSAWSCGEFPTSC
jgi:hypothetical protein